MGVAHKRAKFVMVGQETVMVGQETVMVGQMPAHTLVSRARPIKGPVVLNTTPSRVEAV